MARRLLHTVSQSPLSGGALARCLRLAGDGSVLLLVSSGVHAALADSVGARQLCRRADALTLCALAPDVRSRLPGLPLAPEVQLVDYAEYVALALRCDAVIDWF